MITAILSRETHICRKCGGNVAIREDQFGQYLCCFMCGATQEKLLTDSPAPQAARRILNSSRR